MQLHVLMIDDNLGDIQLIEAAFSDCRIPVHFVGVGNPTHAIAHLNLSRINNAALPDLIICDLSILEMSGNMVVRTMRESVVTGNIPLVVFSGTTNGSMSAACTLAGAHEVRAKPTSYKGYLAFVHSLKSYRSQHGRSAFSRLTNPRLAVSGNRK